MPDEHKEPPDIYSDGVQVGVSPFSIVLTFTVSPVATPGTQAPKVVATLRMSLEHAKIMTMLMRRQLKQYEEQLGQPIPIMAQVYQQLGISPKEEW